MKKIVLIFLLLSPVLFSCHKDEYRIDPDNLLIGTWNLSEYQGNTMIYLRQNEFSANPCYKFKTDGTLTERKNAGWCGTPPISYADYDGNWKMLNDTLLQITSGYWGGTSTYKLDIDSVDDNTLKVIMVYDIEGK